MVCLVVFLDNNKHIGRPIGSTMSDIVVKIQQLFSENHHQTIHDLADIMLWELVMGYDNGF